MRSTLQQISSWIQQRRIALNYEKHLWKDVVPSLFDIPNPPKPARNRRRVPQNRTADNTPLVNNKWKRLMSKYTFEIL